MISVISINRKFLPLPAKELINKIVQSRFTKGLEISCDPNEEAMINYMDELVEGCKENNLLFQVHGDSSLDMDTQKKFLDLLTRYSDYLGYPINVVMHTLTRETKEESLHDSQEYFGELLEYIDTNKIRLSIENLNDAFNLMRLDKDEMLPIIYNDNRLYMTYDIGHEIADYGQITNIDEEEVKRISNVHIHSIDPTWDDGWDHKPIDDESDDFGPVLKGILFLKHIKYDGPVVFEYDAYLCKGDNMSEKTDDYIASIDDTSEHFM